MATGSQRDSRVGKGRFDLLPGRALASLLPSPSSFAGAALAHALDLLSGKSTALSGVVTCLFTHLERFDALGESTDPIGAGLVFRGVPANALFRVARIYEAGAVKYDQRNWELGQALGRYLDSGIRHIVCYLRGDRDEDHMAQAAWNFLCYEETRQRISRGLLPPSLDDLPWNPSGARTDEPEVLKKLRDQFFLVTSTPGTPGECTGCGNSDCAAGK